MSHTIQEIRGWPIGTVVPALSATVKVVFQRKTGQSQYGPWSLQGMVLSDPDGLEMHLTAWGCDDLAYLKGQTVSIAATGKDKRGKTAGVELVEGKGKDGTPRLELKLDKRNGGVIAGNTPNPAHMGMAPNTPPPVQPTTSPTPSLGARPGAILANSSHFVAKQVGVEGVTVGMAINGAVRLAIGHGIEPADLDGYVHRTASGLIRVAQKLQKGELV